MENPLVPPPAPVQFFPVDGRRFIDWLHRVHLQLGFDEVDVAERIVRVIGHYLDGRYFTLVFFALIIGELKHHEDLIRDFPLPEGYLVEFRYNENQIVVFDAAGHHIEIPINV